IGYFMAPTEGMDPKGPHFWWGDYVAEGFVLTFVQGKMVSQLALLFGVGLALQAGRASAAGRPFTGYYPRRPVLLFLAGLAHALLLWYGDILTSYAIVGVIALFISRLGQKGVLGFLIGCLCWFYGWALLGAAVEALVLVLGNVPAGTTPSGPSPLDN